MACVRDARHGCNIYSILYPLEGVTFSVKITCTFFMFLSVWEKIMSCVYIYMHIWNKRVCVATCRHVSFLFEGDLKEIKKKIDIKIKNK